MTFAQDIQAEAGAEAIEGIVIGEMGWSGDYNAEGKPPWKHVAGKLISWAEARPLLDYEYDPGYGAPDCQAICAWTSTRVLFVSQYDGSTGLESMPRNPGDCAPSMPGG